MKVVIFKVSDREYGVDIHAVVEVSRIRKVVPVPDSADFVAGVMAFRGEVVTLIDLPRKLNLPAEDSHRKRRVIISRMEGRLVGMIVNEVSGVLDVESGKIVPPDENLKSIKYLRGIIKTADRVIFFVDLSALLSPEDRQGIVQVYDQVETRCGWSDGPGI